MRFVLRLINNTISVFVAAYLVHGIAYQRPVDLVFAALLLGFLNAFVRPVLMFFSLPFVILTLGLFIFVINALMLYFVSWMMRPAFSVATFMDAFLGALVIMVVSWFLNFLTGASKGRIKVQRNPPPPNRNDGGGPVIDI